MCLVPLCSPIVHSSTSLWLVTHPMLRLLLLLVVLLLMVCVRTCCSSIY